jgi:hypothetical protein
MRLQQCVLPLRQKKPGQSVAFAAATQRAHRGIATSITTARWEKSRKVVIADRTVNRITAIFDR